MLIREVGVNVKVFTPFKPGVPCNILCSYFTTFITSMKHVRHVSSLKKFRIKIIDVF